MTMIMAVKKIFRLKKEYALCSKSYNLWLIVIYFYYICKCIYFYMSINSNFILNNVFQCIHWPPYITLFYLISVSLPLFFPACFDHCSFSDQVWFIPGSHLWMSCFWHFSANCGHSQSPGAMFKNLASESQLFYLWLFCRCSSTQNKTLGKGVIL